MRIFEEKLNIFFSKSARNVTDLNVFFERYVCKPTVHESSIQKQQ